jgi:DNA-binding response OmpR family regulator
MQPHILFAEDDQDTRDLVQLFLHQAGFRVWATGISADVLELAATERFDALLLDNWMPELSGIELCRQIRIFDKNTPILFCSGAVTDADKEAAFSAGAQGYIGKPFDPDDLIAILRGALNVQTT